MPFVQRDESGNVVGVFRWRQEGFAEEELSSNDPAVVAFSNPPAQPSGQRVRAQIQSDPVLRAIVARQAEKEGITLAQMLSQIEAKA